MHAYPSQQYHASFTPDPPALNGVVAMGVAGALITGAVAAATAIRDAKTHPEKTGQVVSKVGKEALGGGLAWAAGAAVARTFFRSNVIGILAMVAVSTGVKYAYDGILTPKAEPYAEPATDGAEAAEHKAGSSKTK